MSTIVQWITEFGYAFAQLSPAQAFIAMTVAYSVMVVVLINESLK